MVKAVPVTVIDSGGYPVTNIEAHGATPYTVVDAGGVPVTLADNCEPVTLLNEDGTIWTAGPRIELSALAAAENISNGTEIGDLSISNAPEDWGTTTFTIEPGGDPDNLFGITGDALDKNGALDYEAATSHQVTITATPSGPYSPITRTFTITVTNVAPVLSNATDTQTGQTTADITVDTTEDTGTLYWVVTTSGTTPSAAQIIAGKDAAGATAAASGSQAISTTGTKTVNVTGLTAATAYTAHFVHKEGSPGFLNSNVISGNGFTTDSSFTGLLDVLAVSAARAYSMRRLSSSYLGSAIQVRESGGNTLADIGFDASGNLDTTALAAHCGSNSGFIKKFYDQSGNGDDAVHATAGNQPRIVNAGTIDTRNSLPSAKFDGTDDTLVATTSFNAAEMGVIAAVVDAASFAQWYGCVSQTGAAGGGLQAQGGGNTNFYTGTNMDTFSVNNTGSNTFVFNGALTQVNARCSGSAYTFNLLSFGRAQNDTSVSWPGWISEAVVFGTALSAGNRTALYNNQKAYWGTP